VFGRVNRGGLSRALVHGLPLPTVAEPTHVPNLSLVVAGADDPVNQGDLLSSQRLRQVLRETDLPYDLVVYDTPPVIVVADAIHLTAQSDGVILVVRSGAVPPSVLRRVVRQIGQVDGRILGILLNGVDLRRDAESYRYHRGYYSRRDEG
jgi:Mrp family chromosome partitioning ATPase